LSDYGSGWCRSGRKGDSTSSGGHELAKLLFAMYSAAGKGDMLRRCRRPLTRALLSDTFAQLHAVLAAPVFVAHGVAG
jgi:hypothetical protein